MSDYPHLISYSDFMNRNGEAAGLAFGLMTEPAWHALHITGEPFTSPSVDVYTRDGGTLLVIKQWDDVVQKEITSEQLG